MRSLGRMAALVLCLLLVLTTMGCGTKKSEAPASSDRSAPAGHSGAATDFPTKAITFIIPYDAGGGSDVTARLLAGLMEQELKQPVVPVNRPGGSGAVGLSELKKAEPDGYTIMIITSSLSALKPMGRSPYGSEDFEVIATVQAEPYGIAVKTDSPYKSFQDLLNASRAKKLNVGTTAIGGNNFLAATLVNKVTKANFNLVPYGGGAAPAVADLAGGVLDATFGSPTEFRAQLEAGNIRVLALTAAKRMPALKDVPTFKELGYDVEFETVRVVLAPKGTPKERIAVLEKALEKAANSPKFVEFMDKTGSYVRFLNSMDTREFVKQQDKVYYELLKDSNLLAEQQKK
ncbi:tripartite tricarboxylate transporter substrate binding protein [Caldinitratiruptor microaerophilus]|uniref:ABC transporter substrate-binding protein n=1 Tax=Caldinitratiruptor microaerophilus TaxID=671077 RepID=A0AA35G8E3_9FIRM|nr:tripartite tricarboxylate transporter substrate binding protein [Caldinitratiruptor microaerophilus]BDG59179.1 ABC transporter substrate-binding protein [Caldinitratiruptor microaerophilus]